MCLFPGIIPFFINDECGLSCMIINSKHFTIVVATVFILRFDSYLLVGFVFFVVSKFFYVIVVTERTQFFWQPFKETKVWSTLVWTKVETKTHVGWADHFRFFFQKLTEWKQSDRVGNVGNHVKENKNKNFLLLFVQVFFRQNKAWAKGWTKVIAYCCCGTHTLSIWKHFNELKIVVVVLPYLLERCRLVGEIAFYAIYS